MTDTTGTARTTSAGRTTEKRATAVPGATTPVDPAAPPGPTATAPPGPTATGNMTTATPASTAATVDAAASRALPWTRRRSAGEAVTGTALNAMAWLAPPLAARVAFRLFRDPLRRGEVRPEERAVHERAVTDEVLVDGERVVTYRWGDGKRPVLMLHGWRSRASRFAGFVPRLETMGLSPVSFDAPGHGDSGGSTTTILKSVEAARQLQERYGPFHSVLANSFGVTCAVLALREGTVRAERLVAVAGVGRFGYLVEAFCHMLRLSPRLGDGLRARIESELFPELDDPWTRFDGTRESGGLGVPMLIIHDRDDPLVALQQAHLLQAAHAPHAELSVTTGLGHRGILAAPEVLADAVGFLGRVRPEGGPAASASGVG